jgi:hypothetical protein
MKILNVFFGLGVVAAFAKGLQYLNLARNLEFVPKLRIHNISLYEIKVAIDLTIINPTKSATTFTKPYVGLFLNGSLIGSQAPGPEKISITAQAKTLTTIIIGIPYSLSMISLLNGKQTFEVKIVTFVDNKQLDFSKSINLSGIAFHTAANQIKNYQPGGSYE